jgi:hypothetical protein
VFVVPPSGGKEVLRAKCCENFLRVYWTFIFGFRLKAVLQTGLHCFGVYLRRQDFGEPQGFGAGLMTGASSLKNISLLFRRTAGIKAKEKFLKRNWGFGGKGEAFSKKFPLFPQINNPHYFL